MEIKNIVLLVLFILGIVVIQYLQAETADEIINKYFNARGGKDKLSSIKNIYMEGYRQMMGKTLPVKVTIIEGKLYRIDFELDGNSGFIIVTDKEGWSYIPNGSNAVKSTPPDKLAMMQHHLNINGTLLNYNGKGNKAFLKRKETIDGNEVFSIKLSINNEKEIIYYFNQDDYLLIQTKEIYTGLLGENSFTVITNFSNYDSFDGILFPQTIATPPDNITEGYTTYNSIQINQTINQTIFNPVI